MRELSKNTIIWSIMEKKIPEDTELIKLYETEKPLHYEAIVLKKVNKIKITVSVS